MLLNRSKRSRRSSRIVTSLIATLSSGDGERNLAAIAALRRLRNSGYPGTDTIVSNLLYEELVETECWLDLIAFFGSVAQLDVLDMAEAIREHAQEHWPLLGPSADGLPSDKTFMYTCVKGRTGPRSRLTTVWATFDLACGPASMIGDQLSDAQLAVLLELGRPTPRERWVYQLRGTARIPTALDQLGCEDWTVPFRPARRGSAWCLTGGGVPRVVHDPRQIRNCSLCGSTA